MPLSSQSNDANKEHMEQEQNPVPEAEAPEAEALTRAENRTNGLEVRSRYKETWDQLATSPDIAKLVVAGHRDEEAFEHSGRHTVDILDELVGIRPTDVILEIGCGVGRVGKILSGQCAKWIGTDISGRMLQHAAQRLIGLNNIELLELNSVGLQEIADNSVDLVYCTVVFMHLYEWDRFKYVHEALRVLKPGGRCFFDNVDLMSDHGWKVFMEGFAYSAERRPAQLSMASTGEELQTYAQRAGFTNVAVHRWDDAWVGVTGVKP